MGNTNGPKRKTGGGHTPGPAGSGQGSRRAGRADAPRRPADSIASSDAVLAQATQPEGGVGGRSGTGQAQPHRSFDDSVRDGSRGRAEDTEATRPMPGNGPTYQTGGTNLDRAQREEERKVREPGGGAPSNSAGAADPPPGAPVKR